MSSSVRPSPIVLRGLIGLAIGLFGPLQSVQAAVAVVQHQYNASNANAVTVAVTVTATGAGNRSSVY